MAGGLRFAANCSMLFTEHPLLKRPSAARACGFDGVEFWWPFESAVPQGHDVDAFVSAMDASGVRLIALNFFAGDRAAGERGIVCRPDRVHEFRANLAVVAELGQRLGCRTFNALYGNIAPGDDASAARRTAVANLDAAAAAVDQFGGVIVLEPLSDPHPYPLRTSSDVLDVITTVRQSSGCRNLKVLADIYHLATNGDDIDFLFNSRLGEIGHVQIADAPGRHEPGTGTLPIRHYLRLLDDVDYAGWIGLEYAPTGQTAESLQWMGSGHWSGKR